MYFHFKNRYNQRGRIIVSMPMNPQEAADVLSMLKDLVEQVGKKKNSIVKGDI